jgi:ABC-type multidrug transport system permease subunit
MDMTNLDWQKKITMEKSQNRIDSLVLEWKKIEHENQVQFQRPSRAVRPRNGSIFSRFRSPVPTRRPSRSTMFYADKLVPEEKDQAWHEKWPNHYYIEIGLLLWRYAKTEVRCHRQNILLISEYILLALFYGFVYFQMTTANFGGYQSRQGLCAQIPRLIYALTVTNLGNVYIGTRRLIIRERASHSYRISAAFIARSISLTPFRLFCTALFSTIIYFLAGLRTDSFVPFLIYFFYCQLIQIAMLGLGLLITSAFNTLGKIVLVTIFLGDLFNAFGGTLVLSPGIPAVLRWIRYLSPFFYCNQALIQNEVSGLTIAGLPGQYYLDLFYQNQISIMWATGGLMITAAGYFVLGYIALFFATRPNFIII